MRKALLIAILSSLVISAAIVAVVMLTLLGIVEHRWLGKRRAEDEA